MNHRELIGSLFIEKLPAPHTEKLKIIEVIDVKQFYEHNPQGTKKQFYTYIFYSVCNDQYYPAANSTDKEPLFLDGLIGNIKVTKFNSKFIPYTQPTK